MSRREHQPIDADEVWRVVDGFEQRGMTHEAAVAAAEAFLGYEARSARRRPRRDAAAYVYAFFAVAAVAVVAIGLAASGLPIASIVVGLVLAALVVGIVGVVRARRR